MAVGWMYGASRHWLEIKKMIGDSLGRLWLIISWKFVGPCICSVRVVVKILNIYVFSSTTNIAAMYPCSACKQLSKTLVIWIFEYPILMIHVTGNSIKNCLIYGNLDTVVWIYNSSTKVTGYLVHLVILSFNVSLKQCKATKCLKLTSIVLLHLVFYKLYFYSNFIRTWKELVNYSKINNKLG